MKKIFILFCLFFVLVLTACNKEKNVLTTNDFKNSATESNFTVSDNKEAYKEITYITESIIASNDDITIEMVVYDTEENAKLAQENQINSFKLLKSSGATEKKDSGSNYYKYFLISNNYYMISSRIENTLIFSKTSLTNKDKVDKILDKLDY